MLPRCRRSYVRNRSPTAPGSDCVVTRRRPRLPRDWPVQTEHRDLPAGRSRGANHPPSRPSPDLCITAGSTSTPTHLLVALRAQGGGIERRGGWKPPCPFFFCFLFLPFAGFDLIATRLWLSVSILVLASFIPSTQAALDEEWSSHPATPPASSAMLSKASRLFRRARFTPELFIALLLSFESSIRPRPSLQRRASPFL